MVEFSGDSLPTDPIEVEQHTVSYTQIIEFLRRSTLNGTQVDVPPARPPITFALAMRREHGPGVTVSPRAFAIHGGHDLTLHEDLKVGETYRILSSIERIFGKTGRSGPMTIVERQTSIARVSGPVAIRIRDRQIVRWRPAAATAAGAASTLPPSESAEQDEVSIVQPVFEPIPGPLEFGSIIGPFVLPGPRGAEISTWASALREREALFHDREGARDLGYADLVVPGPMQSAFVERLLANVLADWRTVQMSMTFRQSLLAGEPIEIHGVIVDADRDRSTCEVVIRNRQSGETTSTGTLVLARSIPI